MDGAKLPEVWLRGPIPDIPSLLQPVAHALLQAREEVNQNTAGFPDALLWEKPKGMASVGFHLQHMSGVIDRLLTYAAGNSLSPAQLQYLKLEGFPAVGAVTTVQLTNHFNITVDWAIQQFNSIEESTLTEPRAVGRSKLPSTRIGLLVHAAEHTMRHLGQLMVTVRFLKD